MMSRAQRGHKIARGFLNFMYLRRLCLTRSTRLLYLFQSWIWLMLPIGVFQQLCWTHASFCPNRHTPFIPHTRAVAIFIFAVLQTYAQPLCLPFNLLRHFMTCLTQCGHCCFFLLYIQVPTDHFWGCMGGFYEIMPPCRPLTGSKFTIVRVCLTFLEVRKFTTFCDRKGYMGLSSTCKRTKHKRRTHSWRLSDVILFIMLKTCKHDCRSCRFLTM